MIRAERLRWLLLGAFALGLAVSITLAQTLLAALAIRLVYRLAMGRARLDGRPLGWTFVAWAATTVLAAVASARPLESLLAAKGLLLIAAFYVVLDALSDVDEADRFLTVVLVSTAVAALFGIVQVVACPSITSTTPLLGRVAGKCHRARGFYSHFMTLAGVLSLVLLTVVPRVVGPVDAQSVWRIGAWLAGAAGLAATYTRGAWIGFLVGVATLLGLVRRGRLALVIGLVAVMTIALLVPGVRKRAESISDPADPTIRERLAMWRSGIAMVSDQPLLGVGPGQIKHYHARYADPAQPTRRGHLHNTPLQILVERGPLGLIAWLAIFGVFFRHAGAALRSLAPGAIRSRALIVGSVAAIVGFLVAGLTEYNFGDSEVALIAYVVMALPFVAQRDVTIGRGEARSRCEAGRSNP